MCDIILASPTAVFGQPEINLGVIPGGGGTQRLARAIGKSRTMELTLTGRNFSAAEAASWGMVSRVVEEGEGKVVEEAVSMAGVIASKGRLAVQAGKEAVNAAYELTLEEGLKTERRIFHGLFATHDQKEGEHGCAELWDHSWLMRVAQACPLSQRRGNPLGSIHRLATVKPDPWKQLYTIHNEPTAYHRHDMLRIEGGILDLSYGYDYPGISHTM